MYMFKDITTIATISDYLPLLNGCLLVEVGMFILFYNKLLNQVHIKKWFQTFKLNALLLDVFILLIFIVKTIYLYKYFFNRFMIINFTALAIAFQILNEIFFHFLVLVIPYNYNILVNYFKEYATELGLLSHVGYSIMMVFVALLSSHLSLYSFNINLILFILSTYVLTFLINL